VGRLTPGTTSRFVPQPTTTKARE